MLSIRSVIHGCLFALVIANAQAQVYTVKTVPNPKEVNNTWVSDPTQILRARSVLELNTKIDSLESVATAQVAIVMLTSIGDEDIFEFSQALFNDWGIGQKSNDNGLLILFVADQRTIRFHTGYGLEGVLPDVICKRIQQQFMVPYFKTGDIDQGMLLGVAQVVRLLTVPEARLEIMAEKSLFEDSIMTFYSFLAVISVVLVISFVVAFQARKFSRQQHEFKMWIPVWWWLLLYPVPALGFYIHRFPFALNVDHLLFLYVLVLVWQAERFVRMAVLLRSFENEKKWPELYNFMMEKKMYWKIVSILFPVPMALAYYFFLRRAQMYRHAPRTCLSCGQRCELLSDAAEDPFLQPGQLAEEKIRSVDYDVWKCTACEAHQVDRYLNHNTEYIACSTCTFTTSHSIQTRTRKQATSFSEGEGEEIFVCRHCQARYAVAFVIPRITSSSSSSSGSSSGSFGGGSSGGGGASSSW